MREGLTSLPSITSPLSRPEQRRRKKMPEYYCHKCHKRIKEDEEINWVKPKGLDIVYVLCDTCFKKEEEDGS